MTTSLKVLTLWCEVLRVFLLSLALMFIIPTVPLCRRMSFKRKVFLSIFHSLTDMVSNFSQIALRDLEAVLVPPQLSSPWECLKFKPWNRLRCDCYRDPLHGSRKFVTQKVNHRSFEQTTDPFTGDSAQVCNLVVVRQRTKLCGNVAAGFMHTKEVSD